MSTTAGGPGVKKAALVIGAGDATAKYAEKDQDGILPPEHIADAYWYLHRQPRDTWTFELDLRPWMERW